MVPPEALTRYVRHLTHDLNNFATVIRTYGELLLAELPDGATRNDVVEIHRAADSLIAYVQRVSRFARTPTMRLVPVPLESTVRAVAEEFAEARERAMVRLFGAAPFDVVADPTWLTDVMRELVNNAREAAPSTSVVEIHVRRETDAAGRSWGVLEVCDRGAGFPDDLDGAPTDPFVTTKTGVRGAGFGLTLAAAFAHASGGALERVRDDGVTRVLLRLAVV